MTQERCNRIDRRATDEVRARHMKVREQIAEELDTTLH